MMQARPQESIGIVAFANTERGFRGTLKQVLYNQCNESDKANYCYYNYFFNI